MEKGDHSSVIYGTHFPNRLFVGCLPPQATADDIGAHFSTYGKVVEAKVVLDEFRRSKRFGFVSFAKREEADKVLQQGAIYLMGKKINVGPAVKKQVKDSMTQVPVKIVTSNPIDESPSADTTSEHGRRQVQHPATKPKYTFSINDGPQEPNSPADRQMISQLHDNTPNDSITSSPCYLDQAFGSSPVSLLSRSPVRSPNQSQASPPGHYTAQRSPAQHYPAQRLPNGYAPHTQYPTQYRTSVVEQTTQYPTNRYPESNNGHQTSATTGAYLYPTYMPWSSEYQITSPNATLSPTLYSPPAGSPYFPQSSVSNGSSSSLPYATSPAFTCQSLPSPFQTQPYFFMPTFVY